MIQINPLLQKDKKPNQPLWKKLVFQDGILDLFSTSFGFKKKKNYRKLADRKNRLLLLCTEESFSDEQKSPIRIGENQDEQKIPESDEVC